MTGLILGSGAALAMLLLAADLAYALRTRARLRRWERGIARNADGVRVGAEAFSVGDGATAVLLIHGFSDSPGHFRYLAPLLAAQQFSCHALRLPGFAQPMPQYRHTSAAQWSQAVAGEVRRLRRNHAQVWIVAHSMGALAALQHILSSSPTADDYVDGLVLLAPLLGVSSRRSPFGHPRTWHAILDRVLLFSQVFENPFPFHVHDPDMRDCMQLDPFVPRIVFRELFRLIATVTPRAPELRLPLLMLLADDEPIVDNHAAEQFFAHTSSGRKSLEILQDSSHVIAMDKRRRDVAARIAAFINT